MDRQVTQTGALIPNATLLGGEKAKLVALGYALQAVLGTGTAVDGLALSPTSPTSLSVVIGTGSLLTYAAIDPSAAFGDLGTDTTHFTLKQGLLQEPGVTLTVTPPGASGYSQVYLVQAAYADQDSFTILPYYNAANPAQPYNGPNNSGNSDLTLRASRCVVALKPGIAATTGTQTAPAPDPGYVGLYLITVPNGATQITSANVALYPSAPFLDLKLPAVRAAIQAQAGNYAEDGGSANAMAVTLPSYTPNPLPKGFPIRIRKGASPNSAALTVTVNGVAYAVVSETGGALVGGEWAGNALRTVTFDGTSLRLGGGGSSGSSDASSPTYPANRNAMSLIPTGAQAIPNGTEAAIAWGAPAAGTDPLGFWNASDPTRVTNPTGGPVRIRISAALAFTANGTGKRYARLVQNGGAVWQNGRVATEMPVSGQITVCQMTGFPSTIALNPGDYFQLFGFQDSGGSLSTDYGTSGAGQTACKLVVEW